MSGHSKWSKVKHQKASTDAVKGKLFTKLSNAIIVAVKQGGGADVNSNFKLRLAVDRAKINNMPKDKIERAIERGAARGSDENNVTEILYEAFGSGGIGLLIHTATDNNKRTVAELKNILERGAGVMATSGSVSHMFQSVGRILIKKGEKSFNDIFEIVTDIGAVDLEDRGENCEIITPAFDVHRIEKSLQSSGFQIIKSELIYLPTAKVPVSDSQTEEKIQKLISSLEEMEDVQQVYTNYIKSQS